MCDELTETLKLNERSAFNVQRLAFKLDVQILALRFIYRVQSSQRNDELSISKIALVGAFTVVNSEH